MFVVRIITKIIHNLNHKIKSFYGSKNIFILFSTIKIFYFQFVNTAGSHDFE